MDLHVEKTLRLKSKCTHEQVQMSKCKIILFIPGFVACIKLMKLIL